MGMRFPTLSKQLILPLASGVLLLATANGAPGQDVPDVLLNRGPSIEILQPDQQALARRFLAFVAAMEQKKFARIEALNGGVSYEDREEPTEHAIWRLRVTRGPVVEKAGRALVYEIKSAADAPSFGNVIWGRGLFLDMYPKTPLVGMLHAVIMMQFYDDGRSWAGGWLGVMPGTRVEADLAELKASMDAVFAAHDKNPDPYREAICKGTEGVISEFRRKPACVGASFYGAPVYRDDSADRNFEFIAQAFDAFTDTYFDTIEKRHSDPVTEQDVIAQNRMRKAWLVDQLFSDPFARKIVPFEVWSFTNVAPEIRF
jgi:coproporphyrinogen III oxidase